MTDALESELCHEISNNVKLLNEHYLEFLSLTGGCTGSSESTLVKIPHCWKSHVKAQLYFTGDRDIVGSGPGGDPFYVDQEDFPCPAIRFGKNTPEIMALREKEKGDWKSLTLEEKKRRKNIRSIKKS